MNFSWRHFSRLQVSKSCEQYFSLTCEELVKDKPMRSSILSLSLVAAIGIVIGLLLQSPDAPETETKQAAPLPSQTNSAPTTEPTISKNTTVEELAQLLQQEILARQALQKEVTTLSTQLAKLNASEASSTEARSENTTTTPRGRNNTAWFNQQALIDAGMDKTEAEQLKARFEELELAKLYLRDQAVREGWSGGKRFRTERNKLNEKNESIKEEFGEEMYDAYLYAAGQSNRVAVQSVLSGSAANNAGLTTGDQVIRYDGKRIYNWRDLRDATTKGDINESVPIQVERDGKRTEYYVQRGPLGIRMTSVSVAP